VPTGELRIVRVGEFLGDDALKVGVDHRPVQRLPRANDAVGERNPASTSSNRRIRLPLREINWPRTVSAAARKSSNLTSNTQSGWSNGSVRRTGLINDNMLVAKPSERRC
jgi:hypothetical protein